MRCGVLLWIASGLAGGLVGRQSVTSVGITHFTWDDDSDDQGFWNTANHQWSVDQDNRSMISDSLQHSILFGVAKQPKRANLKKWVYPDASGRRNPRSSQRSRTSLPFPSPPRQSGAINLVLSSPPRLPPQRGVVSQSLVELLPLMTLTLERALARVRTRVRAGARAPAIPGAVRTCRISRRCLTRLRDLQNSY